MTVLVRATSGAAAAAGVSHETGTLAAGKFADIVDVRGDPLSNIDVLRNPVLVIRHGKRFN